MEDGVFDVVYAGSEGLKLHILFDAYAKLKDEGKIVFLLDAAVPKGESYLVLSGFVDVTVTEEDGCTKIVAVKPVIDVQPLAGDSELVVWFVFFC